MTFLVVRVLDGSWHEKLVGSALDNDEHSSRTNDQRGRRVMIIPGQIYVIFFRVPTFDFL